MRELRTSLKEKYVNHDESVVRGVSGSLARAQRNYTLFTLTLHFRFASTRKQIYSIGDLVCAALSSSGL
jgi:hypothetical protein